MDKLNSKDIKDIFAKIKNIMIENKDWLFKLDSVMGDGDLGLTMSNGFTKVHEVLSKFDEEKIGNIFIRAGITLAETVPSTMGTLVATGLIRAGKSVKDKTEIDLQDFAVMMSSFVEGIIERGKAKPGEKTILDSLQPAVEALKVALESKRSLKEGFREAYELAKEGVEATKKMISKHGRMAWHGEKSIGKIDPGAVAGMLLVRAFYDYLE